MAKIRSLLVLVFCLAQLNAISKPNVRIEHQTSLVKVYAIVRSYYTLDQINDILDNPKVDGITYYIGWSKLNPSLNTYNFSLLNSVLDAVAKKGKKVNFAVLPGRWSPKWLLGNQQSVMSWKQSDNYVEDGRQTPATAPIPWNANYIDKYFTFLSALYNDIKPYSSVLNSIAITGGSNTNGIEADLIGTDDELKRIGFTNDRYTANWQKIISEYVTVFKGFTFTFAIHNLYGSKHTGAISETLTTWVNQQYPGKIKFAAYAFTDDSWFNKGNQYADLVLSQSPSNIVLQSIKIYSKPGRQSGSFKAMMNKANQIKPAWLEIWAEDVKAGLLNF
ncbi:beta-galactosidase [Mucilaginibacter aquaedulcis]|uniref:beta-galactosidase n=1 Tax=Mucilaginibacter aquaedulcis TaxID=1187081 RepID=UPI0025B57668|nr:beta-galactosidase [Mucilaginibacter aquaedulcis]MDN3549759.1 beta-galactosidase [Mucilaginibacter aquaedulcis]